MKKSSLNILLILMALLQIISACGKKDDGGTQPVVTTPVDTTCMQNPYAQGCNPNIYALNGWNANYNYQYQFSYYGYGMQSYQVSGYCGCQQGYLPAYRSGWGLGCYPSFINSYYTVGIYNFSNTQWVNIPQYSNNSTLPLNNQYPQPTCTQQISYSCTINQPNTCAAGLSCRAVYQGSAIGICAQ